MYIIGVQRNWSIGGMWYMLLNSKKRNSCKFTKNNQTPPEILFESNEDKQAPLK